MVEAAQQHESSRHAAAAQPLRMVSYAVKMTLSGHVQGVGFRPFVYRLAKAHGLNGYVQNCLGDVEIVACGRPAKLKTFRRELIERAPPLSQPRITRLLPFDTLPFDDFEIILSSAEEPARVFVPADYFMCDDCDRELHDADDRRYRYPFINCTQCGPRYTLIDSMPYDRPNTSMASFPLCAECAREYRDPNDRRFHAEPVSCPACGPVLEFEEPGAAEPVAGDAALAAAVDRLRAGKIVAVKGIGGFHLMCDARDAEAVASLRRRKHRPDKPIAVMFPADGVDGLDSMRRYVNLHGNESAALKSPPKRTNR